MSKKGFTPLFLKCFRLVPGRAGFTLIEIIMTIMLASIVIIPSSIFLVESIDSVFKSEDMAVAINLARMELEQTNNISYTSLNTGIISYAAYSGYNYDLRRTITIIIQASGQGVKEIKVEVYPRGKLGNAQYLLTTAITHRTSYVN